MDFEKDMVNIEDVRQAMAQGETAALELLEASENRFTPWNWNDAAEQYPEVINRFCG